MDTAGIMRLLDTVDDCHRLLSEAVGVRKLLATAQAVEQLEKALSADDATRLLKALEGRPIGFKTDRKYDIAVIRSAATEAIIHGARLNGDEFQVISGQCYLGQRYYRRMLDELPHVTRVDCAIGLPERGDVQSTTSGGGTNYMMLIPGVASCVVNGHAVEVEAVQTATRDTRLAIVAYEGDIDGTAGKAKRRLLKRLYEMVCSGVEELPSIDELTIDTQVTDSPKRIETVEAPAPAPAAAEKAAPSYRQPGDVDWTKELYSHGGPGSLVVQIAALLRDAPAEEDRVDVLKAAKASMVDGKFDQRAYDTLERYSHSRKQKVAA
jgi:hypothetical protein